MKILGFIIQKEFKQIFRNKGMLPIIFVMPIVQLLILSNAATFDIKNIKFSYIDHDHTTTSRALIEQFDASKYFNVVTDFPSEKQAKSAMLEGHVDVVLEIPNYFERNLITEKQTTLGVTINAIDGAAAGVENVYITQILQQFNKNIQLKVLQPTNTLTKPVNILTIPSFWYNKTLNYKTYMVPGILVLLVTMIPCFCQE